MNIPLITMWYSFLRRSVSIFYENRLNKYVSCSKTNTWMKDKHYLYQSNWYFVKLTYLIIGSTRILAIKSSYNKSNFDKIKNPLSDNLFPNKEGEKYSALWL